MVDIRGVRRLKRDVTLEELKAHADEALEGMFLLRIPRLSVQPVTKPHWDFILQLSEQEAEPGA
jgi:predicted RNA-binding protein with PUA-like domain